MELLADPQTASRISFESRDWPSWELTLRQLCDLELLLNGGFAPLRGFLGRRDYEAVCTSMRLADGTLWPIPITLDVPEQLALRLRAGGFLALREPEGVLLAALRVSDVWKPDGVAEAAAVYGTVSTEHPGVAHLLTRSHPWYVAGDLVGIRLPTHHDFPSLRLTPAQLRAEFARLEWRRVVGFQTRNPMHRAHHELTVRAVRLIGAKLLLHPVVGLTRTGDLDHYTRVRCYESILSRYEPMGVKLALLPLAMRMAGPREAVWHALIRRNYGCTHFIVGRDHAGPGTDSKGEAFYDPYAAQELARKHENEIGIEIVPFRDMVYVKGLDAYVPEDGIPEGGEILRLSGSALRRLLAEGREIPDWFTFPEVARVLRRANPPRRRQGFTVFFTGLSGSGKSTLARALMDRLLESGARKVTLLDGDIVRKLLSSELGFSREHRDLNIRRIGFVAAEITKNGGAVICAPIAPYDEARKEVRAMIGAVGGFVLVHVATPIATCEQRDRKGLYAKARAGLVPHFTGVSDPYERPSDAEVVIDTTEVTPADAVERIIRHLETSGYEPLGSSLIGQD